MLQVVPKAVVAGAGPLDAYTTRVEIETCAGLVALPPAVQPQGGRRSGGEAQSSHGHRAAPGSGGAAAAAAAALKRSREWEEEDD
jgi:hypothetical protein